MKISILLPYKENYSVNSKIGEYLLNYKKSLNVLGQINENIWNNKKTLQLTIKDVIL